MLATLEGRWQPIRAELDGELAPAEVLTRLELQLDAGRYAVLFGGEPSDQGTYSSLPNTSPAALELVGTAGANAGRTIPCLVQLAGDRLRVCYGLDGRLPAAFAAPPGASWYLVTYRRIPR